MKGYLILDLSIKDQDKFDIYVAKIPQFIDKHGGSYIVQGAEPEVMEGEWKSDRIVVLEFPTTEKARDFMNDPEAEQFFDIRRAATDSKAVLVEGAP